MKRLPKFLVLLCLWPGILLAEEGSLLIEILGGVGRASGPAAERIQTTDSTYYLLQDYLETTNEDIRTVQLYQYSKGYEPEIVSSSQRLSFMGQPSRYLELGVSLQISNFKAENLYPRYLSPSFPAPLNYLLPQYADGPFRALARTDLAAAVFLYNLREHQSLSPSFFLSADIRLVLPIGPLAFYVTGSLPLSDDSGNGRSAFAGGMRITVIPGLMLYGEVHRSYAQVNWTDRNSQSYSDIVYDTGFRVGIGIGGEDAFSEH